MFHFSSVAEIESSASAIEKDKDLVWSSLSLKIWSAPNSSVSRQSVDKFLSKKRDKRGVKSIPMKDLSINLVGVDLSDMDLSGVDFSGIQLTRADFSRANIVGANFAKTDLRGSNFSGATIRDTSFFGADLNGSIFSITDVANSNFSTAKLDFSSFIGSMILNSDFKSGSARFINFQDSDIVGSIFNDLDMSGAVFSGAYVEGGEFRRAIIDNGFIGNSTFVDTWFYGCEANAMRFEGALLDSVSFVHDSFDNATAVVSEFHRSVMIDSKFQLSAASVDFGYVYIRDTDFQKSKFEDCTIDSGTFIRANFSDSYANGLRIGHSNFYDTEIVNVDWSGVNMVHISEFGNRWMDSQIVDWKRSFGKLIDVDLYRVSGKDWNFSDLLVTKLNIEESAIDTFMMSNSALNDLYIQTVDLQAPSLINIEIDDEFRIYNAKIELGIISGCTSENFKIADSNIKKTMLSNNRIRGFLAKNISSELLIALDNDADKDSVATMLAAGFIVGQDSFVEAVKFGKDFSGFSFFGTNLSGLDLSGGIFEDANFKAADLRGTKLSGANIKNASFAGAIMGNKKPEKQSEQQQQSSTSSDEASSALQNATQQQSQ